MADLQFLHFYAGPSKERKAIQPTWRLFRIGFYYSLTDEPFRVWFSRAFSSFYNTDRSLFGDPQTDLHDENEARIFNISALRDTNRRLLAAVMQKERSVVELKASW